MGENNIAFPLGFKAWGLACGIKKTGKPDLGVLVSQPPAQTFGALTQNAVKAAPVLYCRKILDSGKKVSHVLVNSGNANACTGAKGYEDVLAEVALVKAMGKPAGEVLVSSTGVIGEYLPMEKIQQGISKLFSGDTSSGTFLDAMMTTDTFEKKTQIALHLEGKEIRIGGVAKGAGMIRPDMATMLAYLTTDIELDAAYHSRFLSMVNRTFNSISVDGDMSTNDTVLLLANGASGIRYSDLSQTGQKDFDLQLEGSMRELAKSIIRDGEGATKLITIEVVGAVSEADAKTICRAIANSPLVKTAFFGCDANWGRVLAAAGSTGAGSAGAGSIPAALVPEKLKLEFCGVRVLDKGGAAAYDEKDLAERMKSSEVSVKLDLGLGTKAWTYWSCDLSYDYVKINAAYRT